MAASQSGQQTQSGMYVEPVAERISNSQTFNL